MIVAGLLHLAGTSRAEVICGKVRAFKPARCVCGKVIDPSGGPVSGVTVKVAKDGNLAAVRTADDGTFILDQLKPGGYELSASLGGLVPFRSRIVVANPAKRGRRGLVIMLVSSYPDNCGNCVMKP